MFSGVFGHFSVPLKKLLCSNTIVLWAEVFVGFGEYVFAAGLSKQYVENSIPEEILMRWRLRYKSAQLYVR